MWRNLGCTQARSKYPVCSAYDTGQKMGLGFHGNQGGWGSKRRTVELTDGDGGGLISAGLPEATTTRRSTIAANASCAAGHHHAMQTRYGGDEQHEKAAIVLPLPLNSI